MQVQSFSGEQQYAYRASFEDVSEEDRPPRPHSKPCHHPSKPAYGSSEHRTHVGPWRLW